MPVFLAIRLDLLVCVKVVNTKCVILFCGCFSQRLYPYLHIVYFQTHILITSVQRFLEIYALWYTNILCVVLTYIDLNTLNLFSYDLNQNDCRGLVRSYSFEIFFILENTANIGVFFIQTGELLLFWFFDVLNAVQLKQCFIVWKG